MAVWKRLCERRGAVASQRPPADISFNHHRLLKTWFTVYLSLTPYHLFPLSVSPALSFPLSLSLTHRHTLSLSLSLSDTHSLSLSLCLSLTHTLLLSLSHTPSLCLFSPFSLSSTHLFATTELDFLSIQNELSCCAGLCCAVT